LPVKRATDHCGVRLGDLVASCAKGSRLKLFNGIDMMYDDTCDDLMPNEVALVVGSFRRLKYDFASSRRSLVATLAVLTPRGVTGWVGGEFVSCLNRET